MPTPHSLTHAATTSFAVRTGVRDDGDGWVMDVLYHRSTMSAAGGGDGG